MYSWARVTSRSCSGVVPGNSLRVVVVVEHQVAVQVARQPVAFRALAAVGRRVAEERAADLVQVDVGLAVAAALAAVGAWARASRACRSRSSGRVRRPPAPARRSRGRRRRRCRRGPARRFPRRPSARRSGACRRASAAPRARCRRCGWDRGGRSGRAAGARKTHWSAALALAGTAASTARDASDAPINRQRDRTRGNLQARLSVRRRYFSRDSREDTACA